MLIHKLSLAATLDAYNEALFFGKKVSPGERKELAQWLAGRQGLKGSYAGGTMFAPTPHDFRNGYRTFTGEHITTRAGTSHQLGEETCRALTLLNVKLRDVQAALNTALLGKNQILADADRPPGFFCCGACSVAQWRRLVVTREEMAEGELVAGVKLLKSHRDGKGRYKRFPFWYTMLALTEIGQKVVLPDIRYSAPGLERILKRKAVKDKYAKRRRVVAERCLALV